MSLLIHGVASDTGNPLEQKIECAWSTDEEIAKWLATVKRKLGNGFILQGISIEKVDIGNSTVHYVVAHVKK